MASQAADESTAYKKKGDEHLKLDRLDDAVASYRCAVAINPDYVDACVGLGFALSEQKQYREANEYLRHALSISPGIADAYYILGTIARNQNDHLGSIAHFTHALELDPALEFAYRDLFAVLLQKGEVQTAKDVLSRAISAYPTSAEFQFYLGNLLNHEEDYDNAIACYQKALSLRPESAEFHNNLADVLRKRGQIDQAAAHYERAATLNPESTATLIGYANVLESQGKIDEAITCYRRVIALEPTFAAAHQFLGNALLKRGARQEAVACFEEVVRLDPKNAVKHLIAALSGCDSERAPSDYVEKLFDQYAQEFDSHLLQVLGYNDPQKLADLLRPYADPGGKRWVVLDLGCGTGLSGAAIAPFAQRLVGVDLSSKMLEKARERNLYQRLEQLDLLTMMQGEVASSYDLVIAADVFIYLGKLDDLVNQAQRLLRPGGIFGFTVESLEALTAKAVARSERRDYHLCVTGRYAHSVAYLARMATQNRFEVLCTTETQTRLGEREPVQGYIALWRRHPG